MPIFEYLCSDCGLRKDFLRKADDQDAIDCPTCGRPTMTRQLSMPVFFTEGNSENAFHQEVLGDSGARLLNPQPEE